MTGPLDLAVARFAPVDLAELDRTARLLVRRDRKYLVAPATLAAVLDRLPAEVRALETAAGRWSRYASTYHDTPELDSYLLAATRRRNRFKVRTRTYLDADLGFVEVKTKERGGQTVKRRRELDDVATVTTAEVRAHAAELAPTNDLVPDLVPTLTTTYCRATLLLPDGAARATIDVDLAATDVDGRRTSLPHLAIVETKSAGPPTPLDRLLWQAAIRPVRFSKYTTSLAALRPDLPANRWHRVLVEHFGRTPASAPPAPTDAHLRVPSSLAS